jgi:Ca2+-binding EF-hand superfamily protein
MKLSKTFIVPSMVALAALIAFTPVSASAKGGERVTFEQLDADSDGALTPAELAAHAATRFEAADANGDGFLTSEELTAMAKADANKRAEKRIEKMIKHRDADGDGKLNVAEMTPSEDRQTRRFERADKDGNGSLSAEEFEEGMSKRGHKGHKGGKKRGN